MPQDRSGRDTLVRTWLAERGFPFEEQVAAAAEARGFRTVLSGHYSDSVSGVVRENDVIAFVTGYESAPTTTISLVIECKTLRRNRPFVLLSRNSDRPIRRGRTSGRFANRDGYRLLSGLHEFKPPIESPLLSTELPCGYALHQVSQGASKKAGISQTMTKLPRPYPPEGNESKADQAIAAVNEVLAAVRARIDAAKLAGETDEGAAEISFPVIVLRGDLFRAVLGQGIAEAIEKVPRGLLQYRDSRSDYSYKLIHVVTWGALGEFLDGAKTSADALVGASERAINATIELENLRDGA